MTVGPVVWLLPPWHRTATSAPTDGRMPGIPVNGADQTERRRRLARFPDDVSIDELHGREVAYVVAGARWLAADGAVAAVAAAIHCARPMTTTS